MDSDIIAQMRKEEADLARKLKAVRDLLAAYNVTASNEPSQPAAPAKGEKAQSPREKVGIDGYSDYGRALVASAMREMLPATQPVKTRRIAEALDEKGIAITGKDPVNALGAMLHRSADITSHGKAGWTLTDPVAAKAIVDKYAHREDGDTFVHKENEPRSEDAGGSDAGEEGAPTPNPLRYNL